MSRPPVSVVMPFAGSRAQAQAALQALRELDTAAGDELILADNGESLRDSLAGSRSEPGEALEPANDGESHRGESLRDSLAGSHRGKSLRDSLAGSLREPEEALDAGAAGQPAITVVRVDGERSPAHARNAGAEHARCDWMLFLDADCRAAPALIESYFATPIDPDVGALAGGVVPCPDGAGFAARYGAARNFLGQAAHLAHPYLPRAVAANLLVRRSAFAQLGGFYEGVRAAEDTDFSWRLQRAGWRLEGRPAARVEHRYRTTIVGLRRQWRGYAAGRAWLGRRYVDFAPEPALARAAARLRRKLRRHSPRSPRVGSPTAARASTAAPAPRRLERGGFLALDALLGIEELAGLALSNRPGGKTELQTAAGAGAAEPVRVVLVADRFPAPGDELADFARTLVGARVEAAARPEAVERAVARRLRIDYREDDGAAARAAALLALLVRHPLRAARDERRRRPGEPRLAALAPAVTRLRRSRGARVHALCGEPAQSAAFRLSALAGRELADQAPIAARRCADEAP